MVPGRWSGGGLLAAYWHFIRPVDLPRLPRRGSLPTPGRYTHTRQLATPVGDVPAIMQLVFQQSKMMVVPRIQFFARVLDIPTACRDWYAQCKTVQQTVEISQVQFFVWLSTRPLLCNDRFMGRATLGSTTDTYSASVRGWLHGRISHIFHVKVELWILRSILASLPANMAEEEVAAFVVNNGNNMHYIGFAGISAPRAVFPDDCRQVGMHTVRSVHSRCFG